MIITHVNDEEAFRAEVLSAEVPVVVDFWAAWCGPCRQIAPSLEALSTEYAGDLKIVQINVDSFPQKAADLGVRGIPALFMFKGGQVVSNRMGAAPKAVLKDWIEESL